MHPRRDVFVSAERPVTLASALEKQNPLAAERRPRPFGDILRNMKALSGRGIHGGTFGSGPDEFGERVTTCAARCDLDGQSRARTDLPYLMPGEIGTSSSGATIRPRKRPSDRSLIPTDYWVQRAPKSLACRSPGATWYLRLPRLAPKAPILLVSHLTTPRPRLHRRNALRESHEIIVSRS